MMSTVSSWLFSVAVMKEDGTCLIVCVSFLSPVLVCALALLALALALGLALALALALFRVLLVSVEFCLSAGCLCQRLVVLLRCLQRCLVIAAAA